MQFDTTYLTEAGRSLATGTLGGLDKIQFTRAVASSHDYSATPVNDLKKLTSIEDVQQTVEYSRIIKKDDTTLTMRVDFPSKDVTTAYSLYTVGFYARPENGDEILYGVLPSSLPDYIAAYDGKSNLNDSFQTDTTVSDADNVLITVSQAGSLNEADLDAIFASKHIATIDDIKANIPATVIDGSKPADFKEAVTLEKGAVDGAGNTIATTKNLADGDAETLKSAKDYADTKVSGKADDSKVVHTADMRKPASDVVGLEDVPQAVVHSALASRVDLNTVVAPGVYPFVAISFTNYIDNGTYWGYLVVISEGNIVTQTAHTTGPAQPLYRMASGYPTSWSPWVRTADDRAVPHLSGANNFDTVPTVNNNPLLLASSLPSDLARTGQDANFTGKLQKSGVDVATVDDVSAKQDKLDYTPANAANVVDRNPDTGVVSTPTDFTKLTVNGGKSVATSDDLKSVIDNSWLPIKIADGWTSTPVLMKYDKTNGKTIITGMMSKPFGVSDGTCTEALLTLPDGFYWNEVDNSMIGINQANILEATINPDNKKELIVSYKWKFTSPASGNAFVGYNKAYSIGSDEKVTGTYYETTSISQA